MKKYLISSAFLLASLSVLAQTAYASSNHHIKIGLNHAYSKADGTYAVVVHDVPGIHLDLYVNDKDPTSATVNKKGWATFRGVQLANETGKISFGRIFKAQGHTYQKPLRYVRYFNVAEDSNVAFLVANPNKHKPTVSTTVSASKPVAKPVSVQAPVHVPTPVPKPKVAPKPEPKPKAVTSTSCHPLSNGGNCYKAGEFCRSTDHGLLGVAGNGEAIVCANNDGWRWEPR